MIYSEELDGNMEVAQVCVMKRSGERVPFDKTKIKAAIEKANNEEGILSERLTDEQMEAIASGIEKDAANAGRDLSVEEIQDKVEDALMASGKYRVARLYITYRYKHNEMRKMSTIDQKISGVIEYANEEVKQENSNKNLNSSDRISKLLVQLNGNTTNTSKETIEILEEINKTLDAYYNDNNDNVRRMRAN